MMAGWGTGMRTTSSCHDACPYKSFLCPITHDIMDHPVIARDGYSYERSALETHIAGRPNIISPVTGEDVPSDFFPNKMLRSDIQNLLDDMARAEVDGAAGVARRRRRNE